MDANRKTFTIIDLELQDTVDIIKNLTKLPTSFSDKRLVISGYRGVGNSKTFTRIGFGRGVKDKKLYFIGMSDGKVFADFIILEPAKL